MNHLREREPDLLGLWKGPDASVAIARLLGETPVRFTLERMHFPGDRPVQLQYLVRLRSGQDAVVMAEYCATDPASHRESAMISLGKRRNGQVAGLERGRLVADEKTGLVLRHPGLDERLPGLRLLYDPIFARETLGELLGRDPGPVAAVLVAHRLGRRAVLRLSAPGFIIYARLRTVKSAMGQHRLERHHALWSALAQRPGLRLPEPLGTLPGLGMAAFGALPGQRPDFRRADSAAVGRALGVLQRLDPAGLPVHSGADEADILCLWLERCRRYRPDIAQRLRANVVATAEALGRCDAAYRPCHRDLHEKQILIADGVAGLLDLDTLSLADPALDAGNLMAHLFLYVRDESNLRVVIDRPGIRLWRRAALLRLAMIHSVTSMPDTALDRLIGEAARDDRD